MRLTPHQKRIAAEGDAFIKDLQSGKVQIDDYDYGPELARQEAIAEVLGIGRTQADSDRVYDLLKFGKDAPYGAYTGSELQGLGYRGIDGDFKTDSSVRMHRNNVDMVDPLIDSSVRNNQLIDGYNGVATEYLSPEGEKALYALWKAEQEADYYKRNQNTPEHFNRSLQEYYGQQALKLMGNKAVSDEDRSFNLRNYKNANHPNTTLGTDRIIETNASLLGGDVGRPAGDYRYIDPQGNLRVGDYQGATYEKGDSPMDTTVRLQLIKGSKMSPAQQRGFAGNIREAAKRVADIDDALALMQRYGQLPQLVQEEIKQNRPSKSGKISGMRAGKMMSDAPFMGQLNKNDQHRYEHVLYGLQSGDNIRALGQGGGVPQAFFNVPTKSARQFMAENTENIRLMDRRDGSAFMAPSLQQLVDEKVAVDVIRENPQLAQLFLKN